MTKSEDFSESLGLRVYGPRHVVAVTGLTPDVLRQWVGRGFVLEMPAPGYAERPKKAGRPARDFHVWQVYQLAIMTAIKDMGVDLGRASRWSKTVCEKYWDASAGTERPRLMAFNPKQQAPTADDLFLVPDADVAGFCAAIMGGMKELGGAIVIVDIDGIMRGVMATLRKMNAAADASENLPVNDAMLGNNDGQSLDIAAKPKD